MSFTNPFIEWLCTLYIVEWMNQGLFVYDNLAHAHIHPFTIPIYYLTLCLYAVHSTQYIYIYVYTSK